MSEQTIEAPNWGGHTTPQRPAVNYYAPYNKDVLDDTLMAFGPHQGLTLAEVPASWFLWYRNEATGVKNYWLLEYIEFHLEIFNIQVCKAKI